MKCPADEWGEGYKLIILYLLVLFVTSDIFVKEPRRWPFVIEIFPDQESWLRIRKNIKSPTTSLNPVSDWLGPHRYDQMDEKCAKKELRKTS